MKRSKRALSMLLTLIILICTFYTAPKAEAADVQKMTNLIVCVRFSENADENVLQKPPMIWLPCITTQAE